VTDGQTDGQNYMEPRPNTIKSLSVVHASPQPKRHLDRFSRVFTDDCVVSLYFTMVCLFPLKIAPSHVGTWRHGPDVIHGSLGPPQSGTQMAT